MNMTRRGSQKTARDKHLLALDREHSRLFQAKYNAPIVPLEKPYQRGWIRYFKLTDEALKREDAKILKEVLDRINVVQYSNTRDFSKTRKTRKNPYGPEHQLRVFNYTCLIFARLRLELKLYFLMRFLYRLNRKGRFSKNRYFVFRMPHLFESVVEKNMVTHQRVVLPEVEARISEIDRYLSEKKAWGRIDNLRGVRRTGGYWGRVHGLRRPYPPFIENIKECWEDFDHD